MNIFFIHQNFPAQFVHLAPYLASNPDNKVYFLAQHNPRKVKLEGVNVEIYKKHDRFKDLLEKNIFPLKVPINLIDTGLSILDKLDYLEKEKNIRPDLIIGHMGWGELFYIKDVYPNVPLIGYFEDFPDFKDTADFWWSNEIPSKSQRVFIRIRQMKYLLPFEACDAWVTASEWQHSQFPAEYRSKIHVIHEGIDTRFCSPAPGGKRPGLVLDDIKLNLPEGTEIITYVARGFEPLRGFQQFMDAIRIVLAHRPQTHVILVGNDKPAYGLPLKDTTYLKEEEKKGGYPKDRVHAVGGRGREDYQKILRASSCHVYLTRPFVLSWSCLEAMSFACPIVGSKTPPVQEVMENGVNGLIADFRSPNHIARKIEEMLEDPERAKKLGAAARQTILERYDVRNCVRTWEDLIYSSIR